MRQYHLLCLLSVLLTACETQSSTKGVIVGSKAAPVVTPRVPDQGELPTGTPTQETQTEKTTPEISEGSAEPHSMKFRHVSDEDLRQEIAVGNIEVDTISSRFLVSKSFKQPKAAQLYYRSPVYPGGWIETQLELVGEWLWNQRVELDTVRLEAAGPAAVLVKFSSESSLRHWTIANEGINIIDIAQEPVLLLKAGTASHESGYNGDDEEEFTEENSFETTQTQSITVRNQQIIVAPAVEDGQYALHPAPPGTYQYRGGKMLRIKK